MIPSGSQYPAALDSDDNLFLVHDSLRVRLLEDYSPGDTSIIIEGDNTSFPSTGLITLTEQCNEPEFRALSFYYGSKTDSTFDELELLPGFTDISKPKRLTNVTMNVMAQHHNSLKDALIALETFIGKKDEEDTTPLGDTIVGRLNFLRRLALTPRAWFSADKRIGIVPATVTFTDESLKNPSYWNWNFGDGSTSISQTPSYTSGAPVNSYPVMATAVPCGPNETIDRTNATVTKTYYTPGKYDVTLTVANEFGEDEIVLKNFFEARAPAPDEATIAISPTKARINTLLNLECTDAGEQSDDPVAEYTWKLGDDLSHGNASSTIAMYSVGGIYDVKLRVDTELGAYRITTVENAINIVEQKNLWLFAFNSTWPTLSVTKTLSTYEFGLISETFKSNVMPSLSVDRDYTFIDNSYINRDSQFSLFLRNVDFAPRGTTASGDNGTGLLYWAEDAETIRFKEFSPFVETWGSSGLNIGETFDRNWNWMGINSPNYVYILFGQGNLESSPVNVGQDRTKINLTSSTLTTSTFSNSDYLNGANELLTYPDSSPAYYRSTFKNNKGYFARNDVGPGGFFRIRSFYQTEGALTDFATSIRKMPDIPGTARTELQLAALTSGVFVFNNSGEVSAFNTTSGVWTTGGPGIGAASFRSLQDSNVPNFAEIDQHLLVASDGDRRAYISYDYSPNAFIRFNEADTTFSSLGARPTNNEQFCLTVF